MENKIYYFNNKNIYITNLEEIKEGDWFIYRCYKLCKCTGLSQSKQILTDNEIAKHKDYGKPQGLSTKIILTTDQDLIKDGIQSIDDEFLEWFVNNPSCKSVKTDLVPVNEFNSKITVGGYGFDKFIYKIIIPQEEPKQLTDLEIAIKLEEIDREEYQSVKDFSRGAKWQARRMYSEEEVETIAKDAYDMGKNYLLTGAFNKWFEQYKKK
jgi:hypothetical protein